jgi:ribosomal protein RSM22 (predicted rRNA methylase)
MVQYWDDRSHARAYQAYFMPVNAVRTGMVLAELERRQISLRTQPRLRVLDLGCGPGSAFSGFLLWLAGQPGEPVDVEVVAVDRHPTPLDYATQNFRTLRRILPPWGVRPTLQTVELGLNRPLPPGEFDVILAANVLSELNRGNDDRIAERTETLQRWMSSLTSTGILILIEPALSTLGQDLQAVRDHLAASGDVTIVAPCPGNLPCPLLARGDWCHQRRSWDRPAVIADLDQRSGLDKRHLAYSFLILSRNGITPDGRYRVLSDRIQEKGKIVHELCGPDGLVRATCLKKQRSDSNRIFWKIRKGDWLHIEGAEPLGQELRIGKKTVLTVS